MAGKTVNDFYIVRKEHVVEFWYNDKVYIYKYVSNSYMGSAYIYKGKNKIYGPFAKECTEEGTEVYNAYRDHFIKNK